jgi:septum formation protein
VLLGADTIVTIDREILGKPVRAENAIVMLRRLSGRVHEVWTGLSLVHPEDGRAVTQAVRSIVKFAPMDAAEIERYVATVEPLDKAGGYAVQGHGALYVVTFALQLGLLAAALLGRFIPALPLRIAYYYVTVTASIAVGLWDRLRAGRVPIGWEKVEGTR